VLFGNRSKLREQSREAENIFLSERISQSGNAHTSWHSFDEGGKHKDFVAAGFQKVDNPVDSLGN
jgi:hypothetical protein